MELCHGIFSIQFGNLVIAEVTCLAEVNAQSPRVSAMSPTAWPEDASYTISSDYRTHTPQPFPSMCPVSLTISASAFSKESRMSLDVNVCQMLKDITVYTV
jgi:hypothetical protein